MKTPLPLILLCVLCVPLAGAQNTEKIKPVAKPASQVKELSFTARTQAFDGMVSRYILLENAAKDIHIRMGEPSDWRPVNDASGEYAMLFRNRLYAQMTWGLQIYPEKPFHTAAASEIEGYKLWLQRKHGSSFKLIDTEALRPPAPTILGSVYHLVRYQYEEAGTGEEPQVYDTLEIICEEKGYLLVSTLRIPGELPLKEQKKITRLIAGMTPIVTATRDTRNIAAIE